MCSEQGIMPTDGPEANLSMRHLRTADWSNLTSFIAQQAWILRMGHTVCVKRHINQQKAIIAAHHYRDTSIQKRTSIVSLKSLNTGFSPVSSYDMGISVSS